MPSIYIYIYLYICLLLEDAVLCWQINTLSHSNWLLCMVIEVETRKTVIGGGLTLDWLLISTGHSLYADSQDTCRLPCHTTCLVALCRSCRHRILCVKLENVYSCSQNGGFGDSTPLTLIDLVFSIAGELWSWSVRMRCVKAKDQSVQTLEWKQTNRWTVDTSDCFTVLANMVTTYRCVIQSLLVTAVQAAHVSSWLFSLLLCMAIEAETPINLCA